VGRAYLTWSTTTWWDGARQSQTTHERLTVNSVQQQLTAAAVCLPWLHEPCLLSGRKKEADCHAARRRSRAAERRFKRSLSSTVYSAWYAELHKMKALYEQKTSTYWRNEIATCNDNNRSVWRDIPKRAEWVRKC